MQQPSHSNDINIHNYSWRWYLVGLLFIISLLFVGGADSLGLWTKSFDEVKVIFVYNILKISDVYTHIYTYFIYIYWRRQWHPTPVLLPGKSHGWRSLVGCSPWGREESDTTERLHFHFWLSCIGQGNGNPLQCSCLENPRDGGAWWAAIYGVTQSRTRLKWLSSSNIYIYI